MFNRSGARGGGFFNEGDLIFELQPWGIGADHMDLYIGIPLSVFYLKGQRQLGLLENQAHGLNIPLNGLLDQPHCDHVRDSGVLKIKPHLGQRLFPLIRGLLPEQTP